MLFESEGYWCYWHGAGGYSGVALHVRRELCAERPAFTHPAFDHETRIVVGATSAGVTFASVYVPNGGKDFAAKMRFLEALEALRRRGAARPAGTLAPLRRPERRPHRPATCTRRSARPEPSASGPTSARCSRSILGHGLVDVGRAARPRQRRALHVVGALAQPAPAQHRLAASTTSSRAQSLAKRATACVVRADVGTSDHAPVVADFGGV